MPSLERVLFEACIVGLLMIPAVYISGFVSRMITFKPSLPDICKKWNENYIMEVNLFLAGFLFHIVAEYSGLNRWYCQNYS